MERGEVVEMGSPWELLKPRDDDDDDSQSQPSDSDATQVESPNSKDKGKEREMEVPEGQPQADATAEAVAAKVEDVVDESDIKPEQKAPKKRWFKKMCETSGDFETLLEEAKKSYEAKRLVDVDA